MQDLIKDERIKKQKAIIIATLLYQHEHGEAPTWRELMSITGITDKIVFFKLFNKLQRRELITSERLVPRSIQVTESGRAFALSKNS